MKFISVILLSVSLAATASFASQPDLYGRAQVRDVDTIVVEGTTVRLNGVDGPELGTSAGREAKRWMTNHLRGRKVACFLNGDRTYDRWVGICYAAQKGSDRWVDIGASAVGAGHALDCRRYSGGRYAGLETPAARSRIKRAGYCR